MKESKKYDNCNNFSKALKELNLKLSDIKHTKYKVSTNTCTIKLKNGNSILIANFFKIK